MSEYIERLIDILFAHLGSGRSTYAFKSILRERRFARYKKKNIHQALFRLKKKEYIRHAQGGWQMTKKGLEIMHQRERLSYIPSPFNKNNKTKYMIAFDIPVQDKMLRNWLRNQIKIFGYTMIQQSLWSGPGPLPKAFTERLKILNLKEKVKIFKTL